MLPTKSVSPGRIPLPLFGTVSALACLLSLLPRLAPWPNLMRLTGPVVVPGPLPQAMVAR